jgi:hypothetical protein
MKLESRKLGTEVSRLVTVLKGCIRESIYGQEGTITPKGGGVPAKWIFPDNLVDLSHNVLHIDVSSGSWLH